MTVSTSSLPGHPPEIAGLAALAICESMLLALNDRHVLTEPEIIGLLRDAAEAYSTAPSGPDQQSLNEAVALLINRIIESGNSVRRQ